MLLVENRLLGERGDGDEIERRSREFNKEMSLSLPGSLLALGLSILGMFLRVFSLTGEGPEGFLGVKDEKAMTGKWEPEDWQSEVKCCPRLKMG